MTETTRPVPVCVRTGVLTQAEFDRADPGQQALAEKAIARAEAGSSPEWFREHRGWLRGQLSFMGGIVLDNYDDVG